MKRRFGVAKKRYATSMVMPCSRSACKPSTSSAKSRRSPWVPNFLESAFERFELILEDQFRLVKQAADQSRLAIVNAAAGNKAQRVSI